MASLTALVTGSNRGIGLEIVRQLALSTSPSFDLVIAASRDPEAAELRALKDQFPGKVHAVKLEVADQASVDQAAAHVDAHVLKGRGLDLLFNNAGISGELGKKPHEVSSQELLQVFNVDVVGVQNVTRAFFPALRNGSAKKVANISTGLASIKYADGRPAFAYPVPSYRVAKAGLNMLTRLYATEYAEEGFVFIPIHPGVVKTDMNPAGTETTENSAKGILKITLGATKAENGGFVAYDGTPLEW